jgi:hypothetical protein
MYEYGTLRLVKVISRRIGEREITGGDAPNWGILHEYMEMSQQNTL